MLQALLFIRWQMQGALRACELIGGGQHFHRQRQA
jgi:hypothetical protein